MVMYTREIFAADEFQDAWLGESHIKKELCIVISGADSFSKLLVLNILSCDGMARPAPNSYDRPPAMIDNEFC
jgi:hypothetical protein